MKFRRSLALVGVAVVVAGSSVVALAGESHSSPRDRLRSETAIPPGFTPAIEAAQNSLGRYFVVMRAPAVATSAAHASAAAQEKAAAAALASQGGAISQAKAAGGDVVYRYRDLIDGFSASLSPSAASALAARSDVRSVQPVSIVEKTAAQNETSVPFIGAPDVWQDFGAKGQGIVVADVDTGIDYLHKNFGGPGTVEAYDSNNPNIIEPGTFPTKKVIGGYDLVGSNYDVTDEDTSNDTPRPDPDPLDRDGHGSHTAGTCCGNGVPGTIGKGVAPKSKLLAIKVWDNGNSSADVLVAGYERAIDPNLDGNLRDGADVITFSGGVDYGTQNSEEALAAQRVVDLGVIFVAAAGNAGNQPAGASAYIEGTPGSAPGVISVAASVDDFKASHLTVNSPSVPLPQNGLMFEQDWAADIPGGGITTDLFDGREIDPSAPSPTSQMFCGALPGGSLTGKFVLVYKGSTSSGDCAGSDKVGNAEAAGAAGVILVSVFPSRQPSGLGGDPRGIPAVMIGTDDGQAIMNALSPGAPGTYNTATVNATLDPTQVSFPQFVDSMADFSSEGPARVTSDLKPDISAPGVDITSTGVGTGDGSVTESGTSMATPHVAGVSALLRQLHPKWPVDRIKAALMNQTTRKLNNNDLSSPVPAEVMGAGRVQALESAKATSVATPASLSFGLRQPQGTKSYVRSFRVINTGKKKHHYGLTANVRFADFEESLTAVSLSTNGNAFGSGANFNVAGHSSKKVYLRLTLDPSAIDPASQENGWYAYSGSQDGDVIIKQSGQGPKDTLAVPWHVVPLAGSDDSLSADSLDISGGSQSMALNTGGAGVDHADLYQLGATDSVNSNGEEDIVATGARSFTGPTIDGNPEGIPTGGDPAADISWLDFLTNDDTPSEPVEFGVQTADVHNTTETTEVDVAIDAGADGVFADPELKADYLVVKPPAPGGTICVYDLSTLAGHSECAETYFADYTSYNGNLVGLPVDASAIGLTDGDPELSYQVTACTGRFAGDNEAQFCDTAGGFDDDTGTYTSTLNATNPALDISNRTCQGFWDGSVCASGDEPIVVSNGSADPGDNPSILALFPDNPPSRTPTIVTTTN